MPRPFPGMDPYLEDPGHWPDFHTRFITYWSDAIADLVPDHYEVRIGERVRLIERPGAAHVDLMPDVAITGSGSRSQGAAAPAGAATLTPVAVTRPAMEIEEPPDKYIEIYRRPGRSLVSVLELLSPSNKAELDRSGYLMKRLNLMYQQVNLVELDLLLRGRRLPMGGPLPHGDYFALVSRGDASTDSSVYAWTIREPLPRLPIPLRDPDPDVVVDLDSVFAAAYERGRYARSLPYDEPLLVGLNAVDRAWAEERARPMRPPGTDTG